ncbi:alpha/beta fold hydrolase [Dickeya zeae]|uniref:Alpha/beta hydrolase n=1 Tax=Dickeya zeae TaxID=204042 RepID=A0ABX8VYS8_9GAMM|nr:alpha/beta hydrolase [Dickeya zeae]QYM91598.1 alpha/beta hydrolase [Dickeya zeae]
MKLYNSLAPQHAESTRKTRHPLKYLSHLAVAVGLTITLAGNQAIAEPSHPPVHNIVLVHGALMDGSSWSPVITRLQKMGYHVTAVQNHLVSLADDVSSTERVLKRQDGDVLLVGHSWGGVVITQAGNAANVKGLVYLTAMAPDSGESMLDLLKRLNAPMNGVSPDADGLIWMDNVEQFHQFMAADVPLRKVRELIATQQPIAAASMAEKVQHAAWHDKPSWYLQATDDKAIVPAVQQTMAQQLGAKITPVRSSHMVMISHPEAVADLIDRAAKGTAR